MVIFTYNHLYVETFENNSWYYNTQLHYIFYYWLFIFLFFYWLNYLKPYNTIRIIVKNDVHRASRVHPRSDSVIKNFWFVK